MITPLQLHLKRLYATPDALTSAVDSASVGAAGVVRALVLEVARPADWGVVSGLWRAVQHELDLPAPAVAVNGVDGYQLWFSVQHPVDAAQAHRFLTGVMQRCAPGVAVSRVATWPSLQQCRLPTDNGACDTPGGFACVPGLQVSEGRWSAFVAPDLAALFEQEPWLDVPPGDAAQADLLSRLGSADAQAFSHAVQKLSPAAVDGIPDAGAGANSNAGSPSAAQPLPSNQLPSISAAAPLGAPHATPRVASLDARAFLQSVMADSAVPLHLRIDAAKALLSGG